MRTLTLALALSLVATTFASASFAGEPRRDRSKERSDRYQQRESGRSARYERQRRYSRDTEAEIQKAESCDPGGNFSSYPAWARAAFSCGRDR